MDGSDPGSDPVASAPGSAPTGLLDRRDGPGLARLAVQVLVFLIGFAATVHLAGRGHPGWPATLVPTSFALLMFFPSMHESGHRTAFASRWLNDAVTAGSAFLMLQAPTFFREFHFAHHRETQHPEGDPEITGPASILDGWPSNPLLYLGVASGQWLIVGKAGFTIGGALMWSDAAWRKAFPYVRPVHRRRVAWESRFVLVAWATILVVGLRSVPGFAAGLLAWPLAHLWLGIYLMPEHTGLGHEGSQIERTRTIPSNALLRWMMWNMPYHAEHHSQPAVPFHALPELHRELAPQLVHVTPGYGAFHREAIARSFAPRPAS